jgi:hypothetical protein
MKYKKTPHNCGVFLYNQSMNKKKIRLLLAISLFVFSMILLFASLRPNPRNIQSIPMPTVEIFYQEQGD